MHRGKKHTESSYQPIKDKSGKVILTSEQAKNVDEDHHEFDHKPAESEIEKAKFINTKMKKMRKQSQQRKAVTDLNKVLETTKGPQRKSALNMLGISRKSSPLDCWTDYERVPGTKEFSKGSCRKK
jgi:hypothetical protein